jgi:prepilin signal peptidase PulO-like enzyme (type II secretory pathway)
MVTILAILFFVFGLVIGSFLNVVIFRYNTHRSFGDRSGCLTCQKELSWYELVPVFSFLFLKGRCKRCKTRISMQYPIVEIITGILFAGLFLKFQDIFFLDTLSFTVAYAFYGAVFSLFLIIATYDLKHKIIPDALALVLGILSFVGIFLFSNYNFYPHWPNLWELFSGPLIALPFALLWLVSKGTWMGLGDAKLAISIGWILGIGGALSGLVISFWAGAIFGIGLIALSKNHGMKSEIPFAPFLVFGTILAFLFEFYIFSFYF